MSASKTTSTTYVAKSTCLHCALISLMNQATSEGMELTDLSQVLACSLGEFLSTRSTPEIVQAVTIFSDRLRFEIEHQTVLNALEMRKNFADGLYNQEPSTDTDTKPPKLN